MKQSELRPCHICGQGMAQNHDVFFYRVKVEQFVLDLPAIQRQHGLASVMGPNEDLARSVGETEVLVCASHLMNVAEFIPDD